MNTIIQAITDIKPDTALFNSTYLNQHSGQTYDNNNHFYKSIITLQIGVTYLVII